MFEKCFSKCKRNIFQIFYSRYLNKNIASNRAIYKAKKQKIKKIFHKAKDSRTSQKNLPWHAMNTEILKIIKICCTVF